MEGAIWLCKDTCMRICFVFKIDGAVHGGALGALWMECLHAPLTDGWNYSQSGWWTTYARSSSSHLLPIFTLVSCMFWLGLWKLVCGLRTSFQVYCITFSSLCLVFHFCVMNFSKRQLKIQTCTPLFFIVTSMSHWQHRHRIYEETGILRSSIWVCLAQFSRWRQPLSWSN